MPRASSLIPAHAIIACDFLVVETVLLKRLHVLVFIEHGTRRLHLAEVTAYSTGAWAAQQARAAEITGLVRAAGAVSVCGRGGRSGPRRAVPLRSVSCARVSPGW
jgi:hypothetical protein